jgi:glycosyltransferase involved in cell wall biosynthesis
VSDTGQGGGHICMVAYTEYHTDARVRREAETLTAHDFSVRCLTTRNGSGQRRFTLEGVEVEELRVPKYRGKSTRAYIASYARFLVAASVACLRLMRRGELDVVHVHNIPDFLVFAGLLPRFAGRKVILDVHDSVPETFTTKFPRAAWVRKALCLEERLSALVAHRVICVNHPQRDVLVKRGVPDRKTFVSMNVPDPRIFHTTQGADRVSTGDALHLVYHGTMAHRLGVDLLISAVARLRRRIPGVTLHLWGKGDDLSDFQALARDLGLERHVLFEPAGYPLRELPARLRPMNIGVIGNRRTEAGALMLPVKLLEYVSLGIPTVAPRLEAIQHYFSEEMVTYYEPEDIDSLTDAIVRLHTDTGLRRRQTAMARTFLAQHGWERQGEELVAMYRTLVGS